MFGRRDKFGGRTAWMSADEDILPGKYDPQRGIFAEILLESSPLGRGRGSDGRLIRAVLKVAGTRELRKESFSGTATRFGSRRGWASDCEQLDGLGID
jgi:hypothetical protein